MLISISLALSQTLAYTERPHTGQTVHHAAFLFTPQNSSVCIVPTHKEMARLS